MLRRWLLIGTTEVSRLRQTAAEFHDEEPAAMLRAQADQWQVLADRLSAALRPL